MIYVSIEGCDGIGKTTYADLLCKEISSQLNECPHSHTITEVLSVHYSSNHLMTSSELQTLNDSQSGIYVLDRGYLSNFVYSFLTDAMNRPLSYTNDGTIVHCEMWQPMSIGHFEELTNYAPMVILYSSDESLIIDRLKKRNSFDEIELSLKANRLYSHMGAFLSEFFSNIKLIDVATRSLPKDLSVLFNKTCIDNIFE